MANYKTHLYGGIVVGVAGSILGHSLALIPVTSLPFTLIAGMFGGIAPDIDHDHGRPIRIIFGWTAALIPSLIIFRMHMLHGDMITLGIYWILIALFVRYPLCWLFKKCTVHRGIFHSVPAIVIFGCMLYLLCAHDIHNPTTQMIIGITGGSGYLIHLLLDELWSVDFNGHAIRSKRSQGTAFSLFKSKYPIISITAYSLMVIMFALCYQDYHGTPPEELFSYLLQLL